MQTFCAKCHATIVDATEARCRRCGSPRPDWGWPEDPRLGELLVSGQYRVLRRLGAGGFGVVYEVETVVGGLRRALKVLSSEWVGDEDMRERFVNEALLLEKVNHPNVCRCFAVGTLEDGGALYLLLEYVAGESLAQRLAAQDGTPTGIAVADAIRIARQIASGLVAAHANGVLHRDLKPENILVAGQQRELRAKVVDFGVAKQILAGKAITQHVVGTPQYMAPEQFRPGEPLDARVDVWQLGATLFAMLTGASPYGDAGDVAELCAAHDRHRLGGPMPSGRSPALAAYPALDRLVSRMLASDRERRPSSAAEICEALARIEHALEPGSPQTSSVALLETLCAHESRSGWWALLRFIAARTDDQSMLVSLAEERLAAWPAELRTAPLGWWEHEKNGERHPLWPLVRSLDLSHRELSDGDAATLAENPSLAKIVRLSLADNALGDDAVKALANSPYLAALEHLDLGGNRITSAGAEAIAASQALRSLGSLVLRGNGLGARGAEALARSTLKLSELDLADNDIRKDGALALSTGDGLSGLKRLSLRGNGIGPDGAAAIATAKNLDRLEHLDLGFNGLGPSGAAVLALSPMVRRLKSLWLAQNNLGQQGLELFVGSLRSEAIELLDLASNEIGASGAMVLASSPFARRLRSLELADNQLGDAGLVALLGASHLSGLAYLGVAQNGLSASGVKLLAGAPPRLQRIDLSRNPLGQDGAGALAEALPRMRVSSLAVRRCELGGDGLCWIVRAGEGRLSELEAAENALGADGVELLAMLPELASVRVLELSANALGARGAARLGISPFLSGLKRLVLDSNELEDGGVAALARSADAMPLLDQLSLGDNRVRAPGVAALSESALTARLALLDLSYNELGDAGTDALARGHAWHALERLLLAGNGIGFGGAALLLSSPALPFLCGLDLSRNALSGERDIHSLGKDKIALLEASFGKVMESGADFAARFYAELFARHPTVKPLFSRVSMAKQRGHLASALTLAIDSLRNPDPLEHALLQMGERHAGYGVALTHYFHVTTTLLDVLEELCGEDWSDEVHEAWYEGLDAIVTVMMRAHRSPRPESAAEAQLASAPTKVSR
jgi:serine/threonine protein kinase/hemoglobin-like flavoprotein/Ran GTPase-activating protein (RanGAP) involved in mRNA processing and transport